MRRSVILAAVAAAVLPGLALAQATALPSFNAPYRAFTSNEYGVGASFPGGGDVAFEGYYGIGSGRWDIRFRGGFSLEGGPNNESLVVFGTEFRQRILTHSEDFPADGALILGVGATLGDNANNLYIPAGLSLGRRLDVEDSEVSIVPYIQPTAFLRAGDAPSELLFALGLGSDFRLTPRFDLRVSVGFGDVDGFAVSAVWLR